MKTHIVCGWLALALAAGSAFAQNAPPLQRPMIAKPVTARPTGLPSVSTAESGGLHGREPLRRLPSFQLTQMDGRSVDVAAFRQTRHWLLLYRREDCAPCDRMLTALAASDNALLKAGASLVVVVADGKNKSHGNRLDTLRARFSSFTGATWLQDSQGAALLALKPRGAPMLYALSGERIAWSLPGLPGDEAAVEKMAAAWINSEDPLKVHPLQAASSFSPSQP